MNAFRFIHTSDLHLGRRFANIPEAVDGNIRGRLMEARHSAIARIAATAREKGAQHILVAGDTFDSPTPSQGIIRQALAAMGEDAGAQWWLLPGNHDNLRNAEPLWEAIQRDAPENVHVLRDAVPVQLSGAATLLPCPVTYRSTGTDLTEALVGMPTEEGALRLGLAHGGVVDFTESGANVPPDRDRSARLDYLALGDWHGRMEIGPRVHYSGSPEQDRFKHGRRGTCLSITIEGSGATPQVEEIETGTFLWSEVPLPLLPGQDAAAALEAVLPDSGRRDVLLRILATGRAGLPDHSNLQGAARRIGPEFAHFELDSRKLGTVYEEVDLDEIDQNGALRLAANALREETDTVTLPVEQREIAADALARLYAYVKEAAQ